jgi:3-deoxy-D-manno-octulosonic-acid transferase
MSPKFQLFYFLLISVRQNLPIRMISLLYQLFIQCLHSGFRLAAIFNPKAKKWIAGRQNWKRHLTKSVTEKIREDHTRIWIHAASLGEFEQSKPLIEQLISNNPKTSIIVSFFSPSGFEASKNYPFADIVCYLPIDKKSNASAFIDIIKPDLVLWIKYEYWWYFLQEINQRGIPLLLIAAIFQKRQPFFHWYGSLHRKMLSQFNAIFVQDKQSVHLLQEIEFGGQVTISGDTRFDRVLEIAKNREPIKEIEQWLNGTEKVVVAGSTWPDDEKVMKHLINESREAKWIIVPHHVDDYSIEETLKIFPDALLYSDILNGKSTHSNILIVNTIGFLSKLYRYADVCFIGGGFASSGIHNTLEAAVYGKALIFGPEYEEYAEAVGLIEIGGAVSVSNALEWEKKMKNMLYDQKVNQQMGDASYRFVQGHAGATQTVLNYIYRNRLLTKL